MKKLLEKSLMITLLACALICPCAPKAEANTNITAIGAGMGGGWTLGLAAIGKLITTNYPNTDFKLIPGGSMANPIRLNKGDGDLSITNHSNAKAAFLGQYPYRSKCENVQSIMNVGDSTYFHIIVPENSPIKTFDDVKANKIPLRISTGPNGSIVELTARWVLEEYGITYKDIRSWGGKTYPLSFTDAVSLFKDGQLDMFCWFGAGESAYIQEIVAGMKVRWIPLNDTVLNALSQKYGLRPEKIPATYFSGAVGSEVPCAGDGAEFIVRKDLDEELVYNITKTILDNREEIIRAIPSWNTINLNTAVKDLSLPMHPGAARFYKEKGIIK